MPAVSSFATSIVSFWRLHQLGSNSREKPLSPAASEGLPGVATAVACRDHNIQRSGDREV